MHPMKKELRLVGIELLLVFLFAAVQYRTVSAEEKAEGFFPKDYVNEKSDDNGGLLPGGRGDMLPKETDLLGGDEAKVKQPKIFQDAAGEEQLGSKNALGARAGRKILWVGLILNGADAEHADQYLRQLLQLTKQKDVKAGEIHFVGFNYDIGESEALAPLMIAGVQISADFTLPPQYNVSKSPTWIVQTEEGQILLEGVSSPAKYIRGGRFQKPSEADALGGRPEAAGLF